MGFASSSLLSLALVLLLCSTNQALDVLSLLSDPNYALFSKALTEANLVDKINALNAVTVLPIDNEAMGALAGKSPEFIKATMSTHVLVGYYDPQKLVQAIGPQTLIETLFQSSGLAKGNQGYVQVQLVGEGSIVLGSAAEAPGTIFNASTVQTVAKQPEVVSVIELTQAINVPGLDNLYSDVKLPLAALTANDAVSPPALAPAPAPSSDASRLCMGLLAAASASAAFILAL